jgi:hypothetical protein
MRILSAELGASDPPADSRDSLVVVYFMSL